MFRGVLYTAAMSLALPLAASAQTGNVGIDDVALVSGNLAGGPAQLRVRLRSGLAGDVRVSVFASATGALAGATPLADTTARVAPGFTDVDLSATLPAALDGAYFLAARVALASGSADANPYDDTLVAAARTRVLAPAAALAATRISVTQRAVRPGEAVGATVDVTNAGQLAATVPVRVVLSAADAPSAADASIGEVSVTVAPGATARVLVAGAAPAALAPGDYRVAAIVDPALTLAERDTSDNVVLAAQPLNVFVDRLSFRTASLPRGTVFMPYTLRLEAEGGDGFYRYAVSRGSLPTGLRLEGATGIVRGTPLQSGTFQLTLEVRSNALVATLDLQLVVAESGVGLTIATELLPQGTLGLPYETSLVAAGGEPPYTFTVVAGALPAGLDLSGTGLIGGLPRLEGTTSFTVEVRDALGARVRSELAIEVDSPNVALLSTNPPPVGLGEPVDLGLVVSGGKAPYTWQAVSSPPPGLTFTETGRLTGTPTQLGRFATRVRVVDSSRASLSDTAIVFVEVRDAGEFSIVEPAIPGLGLRQRLDVRFAVQGGAAPYTWRLGRGSSLPQGFSYQTEADGSLRLFGFSIRPIDAPLLLEVVDAAGRVRQSLLTIQVDPARAFTPGGGCTDTSGSAGWPLVALLAGFALRRRR
jgi:MYXO-CTERM domain-containing protein